MSKLLVYAIINKCRGSSMVEQRIRNAQVGGPIPLFGSLTTIMNAILSIYAGAGGIDAQDWAEMLERMYTRWAQAHNKKIIILEKSYGKEAGIKSITLEITDSYNILKNEAGTHRLVRKSPFKRGDERHTSFALAEVLPEKSDIRVEINSQDLRIDTYRAAGAGGQNVNKVSSAVRITHIPTNIVAACQSGRSQAQNKKRALQILQMKLNFQKQRQQEKHIESLKTGQSAEWGYRIRSYVLYPYKMVNNHRTGKKFQNIDDILDGKIDRLLK